MTGKRRGARILRAAGWRIEGEPPPPDHVGILLAAPHTSAWDYPLMLAIASAGNLDVHFLAKQELFRQPLGTLMRRTGGIPVDREQPGDLVAELAERARSGEGFMLVIAPEGTRKKGPGWRSGFYRLAVAADIPVTACSVDRPSRTVCFGPTVHLTGDVATDMAPLQAFYADKRGVHPKLVSPVQLSSTFDPGATPDGPHDQLRVR